MSIKISELPQAANVGNNDFVPIVQNGETKKALASDFGGGGGGTSDYTDLTNKPSINSVTLTGDKTSGDLNLVGSADIATTIDSTSTNSEVAGAKAVYNATLETCSTAEQVAGTWIDGKPMYKRTYQINCDITQNSGQKTVDISDIYIDTLCKTEGAIKALFGDGQGDIYQRDFTQVYAYNDTSVAEFGGMFIKSNTLYYRYRGMALSYIFLTLYYTKTTDTAQTLNNALQMNTGSLVGMGDRAELLGTTETEVETKESGDTL